MEAPDAQLLGIGMEFDARLCASECAWQLMAITQAAFNERKQYFEQ
ncbi:MAG: hypothetical protein GDYSWBUE_001697 [Candidatus Fervidibacterota bacterium]